MHTTLSNLVSLIAAALLVAPAVFAGEMPAAPDPDAAKLSVIKEQNGIRYVSGGSGDAEQDAIEQMSGGFNLKITLATQDGKYMGATAVRIEQQGKTVLDTQTNGPLFLANLPAGSYTVHVAGAGKSFSRNVTVGGSGQQQLVFTWPASLDEPPRAGDAPE